METIASYFATVEPWHWWALGAVLLAVEISTPTTYLLWPGIAAALIGVVVAVTPDLDLRIQILAFAVLSVAATVAWKRFVPAEKPEDAAYGTLNQRSAQYVGRRVRALDDFAGGRGAVLVDDTRWSAETVDGSDPAKGATVEIVSAEGAVLKVRPV